MLEIICYLLKHLNKGLMDTSLQDWHSDVLNSGKLELYSTYKSQLSLEVDLTVDMY